MGSQFGIVVNIGIHHCFTAKQQFSMNHGIVVESEIGNGEIRKHLSALLVNIAVTRVVDDHIGHHGHDVVGSARGKAVLVVVRNGKAGHAAHS